MSGATAAPATPPDGIPRLGLDALAPQLAEYLRPTVERLGYLGEFFQALGHAPEAVIQFMEYTKAVKAPLSDRHTEVLALAVSARLGASYERIQHERLAQRLGCGIHWIAAAECRPGAAAELLAPDERLVQTLALAVVERGGREVTRELRAVADVLGPGKAVAALLQTTRFVTIACLCHALALAPPLASIFTEAA